MSRNPIPSRVPPQSGVSSKTPADRAGSKMPVNGSDATLQANPPKDISAPATVPGAANPQPVIARGATYYRTTRYIMVLLLLGMGGWFGYDGFVGWPKENAAIEEVSKQVDAAKSANDKEKQEGLNKNPLAHKTPHSKMDIRIQKLLSFGLPIGSLSMLFWALYNSRGEFRLAGNTLSAPGHPAIRFEDILELNKQMWDRKGIAFVRYSGASGKGRLRLDDFIYEREPMDEIYGRIAAYLTGEQAVKEPQT